jgi:hypothetical protein
MRVSYHKAFLGCNMICCDRAVFMCVYDAEMTTLKPTRQPREVQNSLTFSD